jgi:hypothetical protein
MITSHSTLKELTYHKILTINLNLNKSQYEIIEEPPSHVLTPPSSVAEIPIETPNPSVPPSSMKVEPARKRKRPLVPTYDAPWWRFFLND